MGLQGEWATGGDFVLTHLVGSLTSSTRLTGLFFPDAFIGAGGWADLLGPGKRFLRKTEC